MHNIEIEELPRLVEPIVRKAGDIVLSYFNKPVKWQTKKQHEIVTEVDIASESYLIQELKTIVPEADFLAEESGAQTVGSAYCWVIDPLDGTTNFVYKIPYFGISVALTYHGKPLFGMIYIPTLNELFWAVAGKGSYLNGQRIQVAQHRPLQKSLILVGFPYQRGASFLHALRSLEEISYKTLAFRHLGAAAVDLAFVASGRADGLFFEDLSWWDVAAGTLILQEAGGYASTYRGEPITPIYKSYVGGHKELHNNLLRFFDAHKIE